MAVALASRSARGSFLDRRDQRFKLAQTRALAAALPRLARRVQRTFLGLEGRTVHGTAVKEAAPYPLTYTEPSFDEFRREMTQIITQEYISLGHIAIGAVEEQLAITLTFDLNERIIRDGDIGERVKGIVDETRDALRGTIRQGIDDGVHPSVIAKRLLDQMNGWAGLEDLTRSRAMTIARTETANAFNMGAILGYRESGIVKNVRVLDGSGCGWLYHDDPDTANGKIVTLDEAQAHPIAHPNCLRAFAPVAAGLEQAQARSLETYPDPVYS